MWEGIIGFFKSWFLYPGLAWYAMLAALGVAIVFAAIWLFAHWPPLFKKPWFWAVAVVSAFLTMLAVTFIQLPLQNWSTSALLNFWSEDTLMTWLFLAGLPQLLLSGLVQEGAKMVPIAVWWWRSGKKIDPKLGLAIGAAAGAGFGIFEGFWVHSRILNAGWTWQALQTDGFLGIAGFWERFFAIGFHIAVSSLVGYGLAKGKGWQFYLIAAGIHTFLNYGVVFLQKGYFSISQLEIWVAVIAVLVTAAVLVIRWRRTAAETGAAATDAPVEIDV